MNEIKIDHYELTSNELFYSGYVSGYYFEDTIDSSMYLFDEIKTRLQNGYNDIDKIISDLLLSDYYQFMY